MVGSISLSLSQQFDSLGNPLSGGKLNFYQAGTVATRQNAFQDVALTIPYPNPITLDSAGRVPPFYLADGNIKISLTDKNAVPQVTADNILVIGPSSGGGGGGGVDPTTVLQTGWVQPIYGTGVVTGFVRLNARTIGSASSGATERANSDTQALFVWLYNADPNLVVSGGRGASAAADFSANKTIALPDWRGRGLSGLDDMGNSPAGVLTTSVNGFGPAIPTTLGQGSGAESRTLLTPNLPPYTPAGTNSTSLSTLTFTAGVAASPGPQTIINNIIAGAGGGSTIQPPVGAQTFTGTAAPGQISTPFPILTPIRLLTIYIKL